MDPAEFDKFAAEYQSVHRDNVRISGDAPEYFAEYKIVDMRREWDRRHPDREPGTIIDFGGGVGGCSHFLAKYFPSSKIVLVDVSAASVAIARNREISNLSCLLFDGARLPVRDGSIDMILAACVFHHIPPAEHSRIIAELKRVLSSQGICLVFEHNPLNPLTVRAVNTCSFDENAILIGASEMRDRMRRGGFDDSSITYRLFVPGPLRVLRPIERLLTWCPIGAQYYIRSHVPHGK